MKKRHIRMNNTFGNIFTLTSFGESHGKAIGGVIDGFPAGIRIEGSVYGMPHRVRGMEHQPAFG